MNRDEACLYCGSQQLQLFCVEGDMGTQRFTASTVSPLTRSAPLTNRACASRDLKVDDLQRVHAIALRSRER